MKYINQYSNAKKCAFLKSSDVKPQWAHEAWSIQNLAFVNNAFEIYYKAKLTIEKISDWDHREEMLKQLDDCATHGYGFGIDDLDEAFNHLDHTGGKWIDASTAKYFPDDNKAFAKKFPFVEGPTSIVNFMDAVDKMIRTFVKKIELYNKNYEILEERNKSKDWSGVSDTLGTLRTITKGVKPFLWIAPISLRLETVEYSGRVPTKHVTDSKVVPSAPLQTARQQAWYGTLTYVEVIAKLDEAMSTYTSGMTSGMGQPTSSALAALRLVVCQYLPILGGFYSEAIKIAPAIYNKFKSIIRERQDRLDSIGKII
jgi:hypothetical protein